MASSSACVSDSVRWIASRSAMVRLVTVSRSITRRLSRNSVRFLMRASTSMTSAVLSSLVVVCETTLATPARPPSSLSTSPGSTRISSMALPGC